MLSDDGSCLVSKKVTTLTLWPVRPEQLSFRDLRHLVRYIIKSEQWGVGGGAFWGLIGAARQMRTRIGFLAQPEPMRSIVGATQ